MTAVERASGDSELLREGDWGALYGRLWAPCHALARRLVRDAALADEVTQDAFVALWLNAGKTFDPERGRLLPWMLSITRHKAIDAIRERERQRKIVLCLRGREQISGASTVPGETDGQLLSPAVHDALSALSAVQREVFFRVHVLGQSMPEVAAVTGVPLGTVKTRAWKARLRIQAALRPSKPDEVGRTT